MGDMVTESQRAAFFKRLGELMDAEGTESAVTDSVESLVLSAREAHIPEHIIEQATVVFRKPQRTYASRLEEQLKSIYGTWQQESILGGDEHIVHSTSAAQTHITYVVEHSNYLRVCVSPYVNSYGAGLAKDVRELLNDQNFLTVQVIPPSRWARIRNAQAPVHVEMFSLRRAEKKVDAPSGSIQQFLRYHTESIGLSHEYKDIVRFMVQQIVPTLHKIHQRNISDL